ncbi:LAMI_0D05248g1_1 [Lachancea mirantina]|uniref:LAMI_0D05248g1_1 n=1 Tax=Lachancea mirantina TaxID=1230905 RepID=A0A1G4JBN2_9SACH|nr:LAMI_0D05248g1_1 [Lachancea mirantina]
MHSKTRSKSALRPKNINRKLHEPKRAKNLKLDGKSAGFQTKSFVEQTFGGPTEIDGDISFIEQSSSSELLDPNDSLDIRETIPLTLESLRALQNSIHQKELQCTCSHSFCAELRHSGTDLVTVRTVVLFELEMIPFEERLEMVNLREKCYLQQVYRQILQGWKLNPRIQSIIPGTEEFPLAQLMMAPKCDVLVPEILLNPVANHRIFPMGGLATRGTFEAFEENINARNILKEASSLTGDTLELSANGKHSLTSSKCILRSRDF